MTTHDSQRCPGCGGLFEPVDGPTHPYMISSPACWERYGQILSREYSDVSILSTHRLSVDTYAIQHPGDASRRAIQSVGLHLARLMLQLDHSLSPTDANDVMLGLGKHKASLPILEAPVSYFSTVLDIPLDDGPEHHSVAVRRWADETWKAWSAHHDFIRRWVTSAVGATPLALRLRPEEP